jgi:hypothetical protein
MSGKLNFNSSLGPISANRSGSLTGSGNQERDSVSTERGETMVEISLDQLRINDQILIRTKYSTYTFLVIDPTKFLGLVVGGVFGDYAVEAYLETRSSPLDHRLRAGIRVSFYASSTVGCRRVTTSAITKILYRRSNSTTPQARQEFQED